jgi:shikimate kinase
MNIVLIGYRGTGKSTIGKRLASKLWRDFVDTDAAIVEQAGRTIREIFETQGETAFRDLESAAIAQAAARDNLVIAAGGGAVLRAENVTALKRGGKIIWLRADPETLHARISADSATAETRPNLLFGGLEEIKSLLAQRTAHYQAAADVSLDVTRLTVDDAIYHITRFI